MSYIAIFYSGGVSYRDYYVLGLDFLFVRVQNTTCVLTSVICRPLDVHQSIHFLMCLPVVCLMVRTSRPSWRSRRLSANTVSIFLYPLNCCSDGAG